MPVPPYPYLLDHFTSPPAPTPTPYHDPNPNQVLKNAISAQINIPAQYIELELDGTVVSIDIFIGGERGAPAANLTDSSGDSSGGGTGTGGTPPSVLRRRRRPIARRATTRSAVDYE